MAGETHFSAMRSFALISRFYAFRKHLLLLWRAFWSPRTPLHLKALMLLVPAYLLSPIDLIPDIIPFAGWIDDLVIVPMLVGWISKMLPEEIKMAEAGQTGEDVAAARDADGQVMDGEYRRR